MLNMGPHRLDAVSDDERQARARLNAEEARRIAKQNATLAIHAATIRFNLSRGMSPRYLATIYGQDAVDYAMRVK